MKIVIDGLTDEIIDGLCRKWGYRETVRVKVPFDDNGVEVMIDKTVDNSQSKTDFVKGYVINFIMNEYRLMVKEDETESFNSNVEKKVKKVKLK